MATKASTCSPGGASSDVVGWRTLGAQDMREEVVEERGIMEEEGTCLRQLSSRPPLRGEATLLSSYSHEVSIVTRLRSWLRLNEWRSNLRSELVGSYIYCNGWLGVTLGIWRDCPLGFDTGILRQRRQGWSTHRCFARRSPEPSG